MVFIERFIFRLGPLEAGRAMVTTTDGIRLKVDTSNATPLK
jgi:hypothetical protein